MRQLLVYLTAVALLTLTTDAITLYNATEWRSVSSFTATNGNSFTIYKPVCTGRYKLGDIMISSSVSTSAIGSYLVCVDGDSSEIKEATAATYINTKSAAHFDESYTSNSVVYKVPGIVSMNSGTWLAIVIAFQGSTSSHADLRGYAALTHPNCKLTPCSGTTISFNPGLSGVTNFALYDGLSQLNITSGQTMPLYRTATSAVSAGMVPCCLSLSCFCPDCVHGTCNPLTSRCNCDPEWRGTNCDIDVDECERRTANCDPIATCINQSPSYTCVCPSGYNTTDGGVTCNDIDECSIPSFAASCTANDQICVNYQGGFQCNNCVAGQVFVNNTCADVAQVFKCGDSILNNNEECDRGIGCSAECTCNAGFTPQNSTDCAANCGNGNLEDGEECDGGLGCLATCVCDASLAYIPNNSTSCTVEPYVDVDPCARFSGCEDCTVFSCLYCPLTDTCANRRISSDCTASCPSNSTAPADNGTETLTPEGTNSTAIGDSPSSAIGEGDANVQQEMIRTVVPAVVVSVSVAIAGVVVLVVLLKRRNKRKKSAVQVKVPLQRMNSRTMSSRTLNRNTSKYGIERNMINSNPDKTWEPPAESEFAEVDKMPFEMSKNLDFNVGSNQFKVGQQYTDVITITARDKKSSTSAGVPFAFHPPTTKKLKMEFNPSSGIVKKGKPVEVEVTMTMQMTTEIDVDIGLECSSEKKHSFVTLHLMSELSSFIDLDEVALEGGSGAKPVGDGAFGVVYKGKYRGQDVAVKMLKMQDMPEEMLDEFDREVDLMNKLRHKNIVQFIGASKVVGRFALVTEFIDKGNMANVILNTNKTLSYAFKLRVALDAARAMFFLHENKILHRDLKLDNLLCVSTNPDDPVVAKLTDFGTSRAVSEKVSNSYTVGVGTPMYMSPEILSKKPYDTKSDVFSYGVMLWILYCQKEPYKHIEHSWEVARFVMEGNREKIPKDCPSEFKDLIEQCWAQEPSQRPEFQDIVTQLEQMVERNSEVQPSPRSPRSTKKSFK